MKADASLCVENNVQPRYGYYFILGGGGVSSLSMHATAGSDLADDYDSLSQDPLQPPITSERGFTSSNVDTFLPPR